MMSRKKARKNNKKSIKLIGMSAFPVTGNSEGNCQKIEYALKSLERTDSWINSCDNKVSVLIGIWGVVLTILLATESIKGAYTFIIEILLNDVGIYKGVFIASIIVILATYVNTLRLILGALFARIDSKKYNQRGLSMISNLFFGSIARRDYLQYRKSFMDETDDCRLNDILSQVYISSAIASIKYKKYNDSLIWSLISALSTFFLVAWAVIGF